MTINTQPVGDADSRLSSPDVVDLEGLAGQLRDSHPDRSIRVAPVDPEARGLASAPSHELVLSSTGPGSYTINPTPDLGTGQVRYVLHWVGIDYMPGDGDRLSDHSTVADAAQAARNYDTPHPSGVTGPDKWAAERAAALARLGRASKPAANRTAGTAAAQLRLGPADQILAGNARWAPSTLACDGERAVCVTDLVSGRIL